MKAREKARKKSERKEAEEAKTKGIKAVANLRRYSEILTVEAPELYPDED